MPLKKFIDQFWIIQLVGINLDRLLLAHLLLKLFAFLLKLFGGLLVEREARVEKLIHCVHSLLEETEARLRLLPIQYT